MHTLFYFKCRLIINCVWWDSMISSNYFTVVNTLAHYSKWFKYITIYKTYLFKYEFFLIRRSIYYVPLQIEMYWWGRRAGGGVSVWWQHWQGEREGVQSSPKTLDIIYGWPQILIPIWRCSMFQKKSCIKHQN